jgi:succinate dehydrogenase / fumarate reductase iron-sulfur subunit
MARGSANGGGNGTAVGIVATPVSFGEPGSNRKGTLRMRLWRGDAEGGTFKEYELPANEGEVVLDVVHRIQAEQAPDLAVRWNCKAGKCGSCSAEINGRPSLMCMTRMSSLPPGEPVTVSPMRAFPIIRDLVSDVSYNYEVAKRIPAFKPGPREPDGTYRMQQIDIDRVQEFHKCIECFLCQNVCHVIRDHEENKRVYAGPRFFVRLAALEMHPLDTNDRRALIREMHGIGLCNITKCCTEVCPEHIHITDNAIIPLKERVVDMRYDPIAWLGRKLRRQAPPKPAAEAYKDTPAYRSSVAVEEPAVEEAIVTLRPLYDDEEVFVTVRQLHEEHEGAAPAGANGTVPVEELEPPEAEAAEAEAAEPEAAEDGEVAAAHSPPFAPVVPAASVVEAPEPAARRTRATTARPATAAKKAAKSPAAKRVQRLTTTAQAEPAAVAAPVEEAEEAAAAEAVAPAAAKAAAPPPAKAAAKKAAKASTATKSASAGPRAATAKKAAPAAAKKAAPAAATAKRAAKKAAPAKRGQKRG